LNFHDVLFKLAAPNEIFARFSSKPVCRKSGEYRIEGRKRLSLNMQDAEGGIWKRGDSCKGGTESDVVHGYHIDSIVDIWD